MKRLTVIDGQVFQSAAWHRGMGKYSFELLQKLVPLVATKQDDLEVIFTSNLDIPVEVNALLDEYPMIRKTVLDLALPKERTEYNVQDVRLANKQQLNDHFAGRTDEYSSTSFLVLCIYLDEVCSVFPDAVTQKLAVYYDSIPYLYHERYGQFKGFFEHFYLPHTATVYEADRLLTISNTVAGDLKTFLGIPDHKLLNIDGACIPKPKANPVRPDMMEGIDEFVLMPSGQELRKNNLRAIRAFRAYANATKQQTKLVITSFFSEEARRELTEEGGGTVIFTGNVSSEGLAWLYEQSKAVLFPSEYEGLGLPVLEAVNESKVVLCSDIPVFREISADAFHYFNPLDENDIKKTLMDVLPHVAECERHKLVHYDAIRQKYTWKRTATLVGTCLRESKPRVVKKKKIAILCPDPSGFSAIGKVVAESHSVYSDYFDIDYYFDLGLNHRQVRPNILQYVTQTYRAAEFDQTAYEKYEAVIYHLGNSEYHLETIRAALTMPGFAIIHDTHLDSAFINLVEMGHVSAERLELENDIEAAILRETGVGQLNATKLASLVNNQKAVVTHSQYALHAVEQLLQVSPRAAKIKVVQLNLPVDTLGLASMSRERERPVIALAGIIADIKGINIIESIAQNPQFSHCLVKVFGFSFAESEAIGRLSLLPNVEIVSNPTDFGFQRNMSNVDILINVRKNYHGETSLTTLEAMRYGVTVVVKKIGWYDELPSNVVCKVRHEDEVEPLIARLLANIDQLDKISHRAVKLIADDYSHDQYARGMYDIISKTA